MFGIPVQPHDQGGPKLIDMPNDPSQRKICDLWKSQQRDVSTFSKLANLSLRANIDLVSDCSQ